MSTNDFIQLSKEGMSVLNLLGIKDKRIIVDRNDYSWVLHSLSSCNYLKIDQNNFIMIKEGKN